jgi:hypothetical protein
MPPSLAELPVSWKSPLLLGPYEFLLRADFLKLLQAQLANPESTSLTANNEIGCQPKATTGGAVFGEAAGEPSAPIAALADWFLSDD